MNETVRAEQPVPGPVAYCAPGRKWAAAIALLQTDPGAEVIEHPYMAGRTDIILTSPGTPFPPGPDRLDAANFLWALAHPERALP